MTEAARQGVAGIVADAEARDIIVTRRGHPVAAVVSIRRVERLEQLLDDVRDLTLALSRVVTDDGNRVSFADLLAAYGLTRPELAELAEDDDHHGTDG